MIDYWTLLLLIGPGLAVRERGDWISGYQAADTEMTGGRAQLSPLCQGDLNKFFIITSLVRPEHLLGNIYTSSDRKIFVNIGAEGGGMFLNTFYRFKSNSQCWVTNKHQSKKTH